MDIGVTLFNVEEVVQNAKVPAWLRISWYRETGSAMSMRFSHIDDGFTLLQIAIN
jgi:hypothetical protein